MTWTSHELTAIGRADELDVSSHREDGSLRPFITIWSVRVGGDLYIRSAHGPENGWFRRALASGSGRIEAGGISKDVDFELVVDDHAAIDAAYHAKYDRYGARIVTSVLGHDATLRLLPTP